MYKKASIHIIRIGRQVGEVVLITKAPLSTNRGPL